MYTTQRTIAKTDTYSVISYGNGAAYIIERIDGASIMLQDSHDCAIFRANLDYDTDYACSQYDAI
jgi:hypothetical protein